MAEPRPTVPFPVIAPTCRWCDLAEQTLDGRRLTAAERTFLLRVPDEELLDVLVAAYRVRHFYFGNRVSLNFLINAKSGLCGEDCGYSAQSRVSRPKFLATRWSLPSRSSRRRRGRRPACANLTAR